MHVAPRAWVMRSMSTLRDTKSSALKQLLRPLGKSWASDVSTLCMDPSGELVVAVSRGKRVYAGVDGKELVPNEPTLKAGFKQMGFISWSASEVAFAADGTLAVRNGEELQLWSWSKGKLTLTHRARWLIGQKSGMSFTMFDGPLRVTPTVVASLVKVAKAPRGDDFPDWKDRVIALWARSKFPKAKSLEGNARETKPQVQLALEQELGDAAFELTAEGGAVVAESLEYQQTALTRWDAKGKRTARVVVKFDVTGIAVAGASAFVTSSEGELIAFDEKLTELRRVKAHKERAVSVREAGALLLTTSAKELSVFDAATLKPVTKVAVKGLHDFRAHDVSTSGLVLTNNPPLLFSVK